MSRGYSGQDSVVRRGRAVLEKECGGRKHRAALGKEHGEELEREIGNLRDRENER